MSLRKRMLVIVLSFGTLFGFALGLREMLLYQVIAQQAALIQKHQVAQSAQGQTCPRWSAADPQRFHQWHAEQVERHRALVERHRAQQADPPAQPAQAEPRPSSEQRPADPPR